MAQSHEQVEPKTSSKIKISKTSSKIKIYNLMRAELLCPFCYEIPCKLEEKLDLDTYLLEYDCHQKRFCV